MPRPGVRGGGPHGLFGSAELPCSDGSARSRRSRGASRGVRGAWEHRGMTRFAIDSATALRIVEDGREVAEAHSLVGPSILRSHALAALYRDVREGRLDEKTGRSRLEGIAMLKIRLLGDRVSRATAWK